MYFLAVERTENGDSEHTGGVLVAVDFSECSRRALELAVRMCPAGGDITVLHVIDAGLAAKVEDEGLGSYAEVIARMRERAEREMEALKASAGGPLESLIVEGLPFAEIGRIAKDLDCDLIVMGAHGRRERTEEILFGGTAEKVVRTSRRPVLCVP